MNLSVDELSAAMRAATADLAPKPDLVDVVLRGGTRRRTRRRIAIAAGAVAVAAVLAGTATVVVPALTQDRAQTANDGRLNQPTRGELAGNTNLLAAVVAAWQRDLPHSPENLDGAFNDPVGRPHVYWAGNTPAGPAAIVLQPIRVDNTNNLFFPASAKGQIVTVTGLVGTDVTDGVVKILGLQHQTGHELAAFRFGSDDQTMLVVDSGTPLYLSYLAAYTNMLGKSARDWTRLTVVDGVARAVLPPNTPQNAAWLLDRQPPNNITPANAAAYRRDATEVPTASGYLGESTGQQGGAQGGLAWHQSITVGTGSFPGIHLATTDDPFMAPLYKSGLVDPMTFMTERSPWSVLAKLANGEGALLGEYQEAGEAHARLYAVLYRPDSTVDTVLAGGLLQSDAELPVQLRMPDGEVVVAANGAPLNYRIGPTNQWVPANGGAALLPSDATQVQVLAPGKAPVTVTLTR